MNSKLILGLTSILLLSLSFSLAYINPDYAVDSDNSSSEEYVEILKEILNERLEKNPSMLYLDSTLLDVDLDVGGDDKYTKGTVGLKGESAVTADYCIKIDKEYVEAHDKFWTDYSSELVQQQSGAACYNTEDVICGVREKHVGENVEIKVDGDTLRLDLGEVDLWCDYGCYDGACIKTEEEAQEIARNNILSSDTNMKYLTEYLTEIETLVEVEKITQEKIEELREWAESRNCKNKEVMNYECGIWEDVCAENESDRTIDFGGCENGACIEGKCFSLEDLGNCISSGHLTTEECLTRGKDCLKDDSCKYQNSIYKTSLYWSGYGVSSVRGFGGDSVFNLNEEAMDQIKNGELELTLNLENSKLEEGTTVTFEIYSWKDIASQNEIKEMWDQKYKYLVTDESKITEEEALAISRYLFSTEAEESQFHKSIEATIDKDGNARVQWVISEEDMKNYDGRRAFRFEIKNDGSNVYTKNSGNNINEWGTIEQVAIDSKNLIFTTIKGKCKGTIPCNYITNEEDCSEVVTEVEAGWGGSYAKCDWDSNTNSCEGKGISCDVITNEDECGSLEYCKWKEDNFWSKFTNWLSNLF